MLDDLRAMRHNLIVNGSIVCESLYYYPFAPKVFEEYRMLSNECIEMLEKTIDEDKPIDPDMRDWFDIRYKEIDTLFATLRDVVEAASLRLKGRLN